MPQRGKEKEQSPERDLKKTEVWAIRHAPTSS